MCMVCSLCVSICMVCECVYICYSMCISDVCVCVWCVCGVCMCGVCMVCVRTCVWCVYVVCVCYVCMLWCVSMYVTVCVCMVCLCVQCVSVCSVGLPEGRNTAVSSACQPPGSGLSVSSPLAQVFSGIFRKGLPLLPAWSPAGRDTGTGRPW